MTSSILVSSAGTKIPLISAVKAAAIRTTRNPRVITADINPNSLCQYFSDDFWVMRQLESYTDNELISELIKRSIIFCNTYSRWGAAAMGTTKEQTSGSGNRSSGL